VDELECWLASLGLAQLADVLRANEVDLAVLPELTEADLEKLGISLGHRKKLLKATARLPRHSSPLPAHILGTAGAERRQVTVLFCDMVDSTTLASRLDLEDLREVMGAYQKRVAETIAGFDGFVAKYLGDGVLAYFGYPRAHEDDAERAVRTGLQVASEVQALEVRPDAVLACRVGIATGLVLVGDLITAGFGDERGVIGETPNLAARLQSLAEPGAVVLDSGTRSVIGDLFECRNLGLIRMKGFPDPMPAWQVIGESAIESRFEALHFGRVTPLVGRVEEIDLLLDLWERAKGGTGQVALVSGEPGIGKSRIGMALEERIEADAHARMRYFCSPYHADSALHPVISQLEHAACFARDDAPEAKLAKLEEALGGMSLEAGDVPLLADLLRLPASARYPRLDLAPQRKKEETFRMLLRQIDGLASREPVLALFEDVHWIDPTSRELLDRMIERAQSQRILILVTFRPEFHPPWSGQPHVILRTLGRLGQHEGATLVERIVGSRTLPPGITQEIVGRTDGIPLFLEELTKAVLEAAAADGDADGAVPALPGSLAVPATLHASLMARLDRLGSAAREVAQIGAAIGREFAYELLRAVAASEGGDLDVALGRLAEAGLVFQSGTPPQSTYLFKHALVQEAAYSTLLRGTRQDLHGRIARTLEERFAASAELQPEVLARHFAEAQQVERAVVYWLEAGQQAAARSANVEAIRHRSKGLQAIRTLPEDPSRDRQELALQIAMGTPSIAVHGYAAPQTGVAYGRARVLCERLGDADALLATLSGEFVFHFVRGDHRMMRELTDQVRRASERTADESLRLAAHRLAGITAMYAGDFPEARSEFETILQLYDPTRHRPPPVHYVHDPEVSALTYLSLVLWMLGYPEQAQRSSEAAFRCAAGLNQANLTAHVHNFAGAGLAELLGDLSAVRAHANAIVDLADRHSLGYWRVNGLILRGWTMAREGAAQAGIETMRANATARAARGVSWYQVRYLCMLAEAHAQAEQAELGLQVVTEARHLIARSDERMWEGELHRVEGELRRAQGASTAEIGACLAQALEKTRRQGAKSLELRAAISLARLWRANGLLGEARNLVAAAYGSFTEGFETLDLRRARALLDSLD
jgi:predicted ATPase/class 3 adenylate cyclase